ncbi:MAG TPA: hypothetical protein VK484_06890 [Ferruginibacter sp.]|nr:hypothetical protein [Ferruginibacter sp.]
MKKLIVMLAVCTFAIIGKVSAQGAGKVSMNDISFAADIKEGLNNILIKEGKGTLQFMKKGDIISDVEVRQVSGAIIKLRASRLQGTLNNGRSFSSSDKTIDLLISKSKDISNGKEHCTITIYQRTTLTGSL